MAEELLDTPEVDVEQQEVETQDPEPGDQTDPEAAKTEEPFLSVNERTVYKSKDDAIRGYNEAANRIAQLSSWEKEAKRYGLASASDLKAVADEILALRAKVAEAAKATAKPTPKSDPADPKTKEREQVVKYLKENGFISKEEQDAALKELRDQLAEFKQAGARSEELRFENQEAEARNEVSSWLSTAGIKDDASGTKNAIIGTLIKDWVNGSDERVERWSKGGVEAKNLIKEGFDHCVRLLGWQAAATTVGKTVLKPTDPGYAAAKAKAIATNKKPPTPGTGKEAKKDTPKQKGAINAELHEKAWKLFQEAESANA